MAEIGEKSFSMPVAWLIASYLKYKNLEMPSVHKTDIEIFIIKLNKFGVSENS